MRRANSTKKAKQPLRDGRLKYSKRIVFAQNQPPRAVTIMGPIIGIQIETLPTECGYYPFGSNPRSGHFEQARSPHAAPDAHGDDDIFYATAPAFDQGVAHHACPRHAIGVSDGYSAAVYV